MNIKETHFPCDKCGICCSMLPKNSIYEGLRNKNGVCKHFDVNKRHCKIYDNRPEICNVIQMYKYFKDNMSLEEYIKINVESCKILKEMG